METEHDEPSHDERLHREHNHDHVGGEVVLAEVLDLHAEIFHSYIAEVCDWVGELTAGLPCGRILDLGCGTGTGTFARI